MLVDKILHNYHHYRQGSLSMYHPRHNQVPNGYTHTRVGMIHHDMINVGVVHRTLVRSLKDVGLLIFIDRNRVIGGEGIMPKMSEMFYTKCATGANSYQYTNTPPPKSPYLTNQDRVQEEDPIHPIMELEYHHSFLSSRDLHLLIFVDVLMFCNCYFVDLDNFS